MISLALLHHVYSATRLSLRIQVPRDCRCGSHTREPATHLRVQFIETLVWSAFASTLRAHSTYSRERILHAYTRILKVLVDGEEHHCLRVSSSDQRNVSSCPSTTNHRTTNSYAEQNLFVPALSALRSLRGKVVWIFYSIQV